MTVPQPLKHATPWPSVRQVYNRPALYCEIVNGTYDLKGGQELDPAKLLAADPNTERQVKKAEAYFNVLPEPTPLYNHFTPAMWLLANPGKLSGDAVPVLATLERTETLFKALNELIGR